MLNAPFSRTIFLDFDARPCTRDFAALLVRFQENPAAGDPQREARAAAAATDEHARKRDEAHNGGGGGGGPGENNGGTTTKTAATVADIAITNKFAWQDRVPQDSAAHHTAQHNSACVLLDVRSPRTLQLLALYAEVARAGSSHVSKRRSHHVAVARARPDLADRPLMTVDRCHEPRDDVTTMSRLTGGDPRCDDSCAPRRSFSRTRRRTTSRRFSSRSRCCCCCCCCC